jgi:hypothetical protein
VFPELVPHSRALLANLVWTQAARVQLHSSISGSILSPNLIGSRKFFCGLGLGRPGSASPVQ